MKTASKVLSNENFCDLIMKFLSNKDIIKFSSLSKKISHFANKAINELCLNYFSSSCEEYSLFPKLYYDNSDTLDNDSDCFLNNINIINWKKIFVCGKQIEYLFSTLNLHYLHNFKEDCLKTKENLFKSFKDFYSLQNIRRSNLYLESDLNSNHQTFLFDFLYETQDLYDYYENNNKCKNENGVFSECLNKMNLFIDILNNQSQFELFQKLRFYHFEFENLQILNLSYDSMIDFISNFRYHFINHVEKIRASNNHPIINLLDYIYLTVIFFCIITFCDIIKYKDQSFIFLDSILKRYKAFVESAIKINNFCENLNVLVNLLYERQKGNNIHFHPRFSIYRMMLIVFNRIVIHPLMEEKNEFNFTDLTLKLFDAYLRGELKKVIEEKDKEDGFIYSSGNETTSDISLISTFQSTININKGIDTELYNESEISGSDSNGQIEMIIEQISLLLVDQISNEYSVFYINSTSFPLCSNYQTFQRKIVDVLSKAAKEYLDMKRNEKDLHNFFMFFRENDFLNTRFINITKNRIENQIADIFYIEAKKEMICYFDKFLEDYNPTINMNKKQKRSKIQKFPFYFDLKNYASNKKIENIEDAISIFFLTYNKTMNYQLIMEIYEWISQINKEQERIDEIVIKETLRRNILLTKTIYKPALWNYDMSMSINEVIQKLKTDT